jgi:MFS family permease
MTENPPGSTRLETAPSNMDSLADYKTSEAHIEEVTIARLTDEDLVNLSAESLRFKSWTMFRIFLILVVQGCNQAGYGIDWGVISGINSFSPWHAYFGFPNSGGTLGTINALMTIGTICGAPFLSFADIIGRRGINFAGNFIVIIAAILQGCSTSLPMFMGGRFLLGFGSAIMSSPQYIGEIAPTHLRGRLVGFFGACFQVGSLAILAGMIGFAKMTSNWSWRIPLLLEAVFPVIVCTTIYFLTPESPRYLMLRGREDEARKVIARYHTTEGNNPNHPLVNVVVEQMRESLRDNIGYRVFWDYRVFFTRKVWYRTFVLILYSIFQQWNGGGIVSQYLSPALDTVGITKPIDQVGVNFGLTAVYFVFTVAGSYLVDKVRRRTLIFSGLISFVLIQTATTITSWQYSLNPKLSTASLTVFWVFFFQMCSSLLIATMHNLYPVEILSLELRARGMGLFGLIQGAAGTVSNYGISVGISKLGYKIWCVYIIYNTVQLGLSYLVFPETSKLSLEEIDSVFETPGVRPVKMSLNIEKAKKERARLEGN